MLKSDTKVKILKVDLKDLQTVVDLERNEVRCRDSPWPMARTSITRKAYARSMGKWLKGESELNLLKFSY